MERENKYIMKSFQNSTIGSILKEFTVTSGKNYSKLNFVFDVCKLSFLTLKACQQCTDNRHDVKFTFP